MDGDDYREYIVLLKRATERFGWDVLGFCLMPNHIHMLVLTRHPNLSEGMQWLHSIYARRFNKRRGREGRGHAFQGRFKSPVVDTDRYFLRVAVYITANAVAAGLCNRPEEWPWSSSGLIEQGVGEWIADELLRARLQELTGRDDFFSEIVL